MRIATGLTLFIALVSTAAQGQVTIKAVNKLPLARSNQTLEVTREQLASLNARDLMTVHIKDSAGKELLAQAVDTNFDSRHVPDIVIFQADFGPGETKTFTASVGPKQVFTEDQFKARGRFVRERFDDFNWENDRIAHRMYGKALETWEGEPLTSSTIDIWSKRTPKMVTDKWYMVDDYHVDHGEGADFYSAGPSRGVGGSGLWANNQLYVSKNYVASRVLTNGPIRVMFELDYDAFDVNGTKVTETKRISLDGGSQMDRYQSTYKIVEGQGPLTVGIGLKKVNGDTKDTGGNWVAKWEAVEKNAGMQGLAAIVDPKSFVEHGQDQRNLLILAKPDANNTIVYWAGFCWDKAGLMTNFDSWKKYVGEFAQGLASPIEVSVGQ